MMRLKSTSQSLRYFFLIILFSFFISLRGAAQPSQFETIAGVIRFHGSQNPDRIALIYRDCSISYGQLYERSLRVANALAEEGIRSQERVIFLDKNSAEYVEVLLGCSLLNAVFTPVNWRLAPQEIADIVNDSQSKVIIAGGEFVPLVESIVDQLRCVKKIVIVDEHSQYVDYNVWVSHAPSVDPETDVKESDIALQLYTSGTTGRPKGVMLTNDNILVRLKSGRDDFGFDNSSLYMAVMPLFHIGSNKYVFHSLYFGGKSLMVRDTNPENIVKMIAKYQVTHTFLVPSMLQFILQLPALSKKEFSSLKAIMYGGSPISERTLSDAIKLFDCNFWQVYGLTESTGIARLSPLDHALASSPISRLRSVGKPNPGVEIRLVNPSSFQDVQQGEVGEIWIRSRQNMAGYWNRLDLTAETILSDGWLRTGDAGYFDPEGYLYLTDRINHKIISGGENIYPAEIENILLSIPDILDAAVIGVASERWGETPKAIVVKRADSSISADEIIAYCRARLAHYKCPTSVDFVESLPRNASGKLLKWKLRDTSHSVI